MKKICAIISGGEKSSFEKIEESDFVIACDKGYQYAKENNIRLDYVIGDFDSYKGNISDDINVLKLPTEKDDTDTMTAIRYAVEKKYTDIYLYCALGGRLDHMLGNIQAVSYAAANGIKIHIYDENNDISIFSKSYIYIEPINGYSLSVFSLTDYCNGVTIKGTKYLLEDSILRNTVPIGVSNEWVDTAYISVEEGIIMVVASKIV